MTAFVRFALAGATGYVVNLAVYGLAVHGLGIEYRVGAVLAFSVALTTTFLLNRHYTFQASDQAKREQAPRYIAVALVAFAVNLAALQVFVDVLGVIPIVGQALAIAIAAPVNFAGQRLWAFAPRDTAQA